MTEPSATLDLDLRVVDVSPEYLEMTMSTRDELCGRTLFEAFPERDDDPDLHGKSDLQRSLEKVRDELTVDVMAPLRYDIQDPDGAYEVRWWQVTNRPVLNDDGTLKAILVEPRDITGSLTGSLHTEDVRRVMTEFMTPTRLLGVRAKHWAAIGGVVVGLLCAIPLHWLTATSGRSQANCQQIELLKMAIRGSIRSSVASLGQPGSAGYFYYRSHPAELKQAQADALRQIYTFRASPC